jgi:secretion/DNA translocation related TadE-like protein
VNKNSQCRRDGSKCLFVSSSGSATILGLGLVVGLVAAWLAANLAVNALVSAQKLGVEADLAAIAAADVARGLATGEPCQAAGRIAHIYMVSLDSCRIVGFESFIRLHSVSAGLTLEATSRAGPPGRGN